MNAEDTLATIKYVEKTGDKGKKDDDRRGRKRECQTVGLMTGEKGNTKELHKR